jgi:hypothetical protein
MKGSIESLKTCSAEKAVRQQQVSRARQYRNRYNAPFEVLQVGRASTN